MGLSVTFFIRIVDRDRVGEMGWLKRKSVQYVTYRVPPYSVWGH